MTCHSRPVVLVTERLAPAALDLLRFSADVREVDGTDRPALLSAVVEAEALLVRSATRVDAEVLAAAPRLKVVARAGVGLDNVDVAPATERGVMVVNAPTSNIVSAAEHAVGLLLAVLRRIPEADASLRSGQWKRGSFTGSELAGRTVGVIGLGRIGQLFAQRVAAFGTRLIAHDPYVAPARAGQLGIELLDLDTVLALADVVSIHLPRTAETQGLIGAAELARTKPGVVIINAARGGLIDERALAEAVRTGRVAGAGIDVFATEPCVESPLFELPGVVVTPHLGAATVEAQDRAGTDAVRSVLAALRGDFVPDAVNIDGGGVGEEVRPYLSLTQKLGHVLAALVQSPPTSVTVTVRGELSGEDTGALPLAALRGVFAGVVERQVTFVNARRVAAERGVGVDLVSSPESPDHRSLVTVSAVLTDGSVASVSGTLSGPRRLEKIVGINGRHFDLRAHGHTLVLDYPDRPGVMGTVGTLLGEAGINVEAAQISQTEDGADATMVLRVSRSVDAGILDALTAALGARRIRAIHLD